MKRIRIAFVNYIFILLISLLSSAQVLAASLDTPGDNDWPDGPGIYAQGAIVMEASTGLILYEKNINDIYFPASITKIMTALVAIENSSLGEIVTFSKDAVFKVDLDSSRIGIDVGEQLTMQQCLYGILLESANEVSYAVAEHVGGTIEEFTRMMNEKAKSLGCLNTNFVNPHGLPDPEHVTTPYDMALITREAMKNETFRKIFGTRTYVIPPTNIQPEARPLRNHHKFILKETYLYEDCIGGKTGYTSKAKYTLVTVAKRGDLELICVIMRDDTSAHQYTDTQELLDYGFDNFSIYSIAELESDNVLTESPMFTRFNPLLSKSNNPIVTDENGYLVLPNTASFEDAKKEISFYSASEITEGSNVIGTISYTYQDKYVGGADILYNEVTTPILTESEPKQQENPTVVTDTKEEPEKKASGSLRPIIISVIVGLFVVIIGLYYFLVERPRIKRRNAYYRRRAMRNRYHDDDFLDL